VPPPRTHARKKKTPKRVLALPDLEHAKSAVLSSLTSRSGQRTYDHTIREFVAWYRSERRCAVSDRIGIESDAAAWPRFVRGGWLARAPLATTRCR
jgi:hypothetical protein